MPSQAFTIEVRGTSALLSHTCNWSSDVDAPDCTIEMPRDSVIAIQVASIGRFDIDGDLEFDPTSPVGGPKLLRWTDAAKVAGQGSCSITIAHPNDDFDDIDLSVDMSEEASLQVDEADEPEERQPLTNSDAINRYGAYACCVFAALGALFFAFLMPSHAKELAVAAGVIGWWGWWMTEPYDRFVLRIVGFVAAGITMGFAMAMPDYTNDLIEAAGVMSALAIVWGDE